MESGGLDYAGAYSEIHRNPKRFPGFSIKAYVVVIAELVTQHHATTLLDFGCGKARGYFERRYHDAWGGIMPTLYDIGVPKFSTKPTGQFGGVLNTDMLEHIDEADVPEILTELVNYVFPGGFLFLGIACRPSRKRLPDGRDVHLTVRPPEWWIAQIKAAMPKIDHTELGGKTQQIPMVHIVAHFDIAGHFDEPDSVWDSMA